MPPARRREDDDQLTRGAVVIWPDGPVEYVAFRRQFPTAADVWAAAYRADWMLYVLRHNARRLDVALRVALREFACWCARDIGATPQMFPALGAAEAHVQGRLSEAAMKSAREATSGGASGALTVGLPRCSPIACAQLAAFHSCSHDPHSAAEGASRFNALAKAFQHASESAVALKTDSRTWCESHAREVETIKLAALRRQVPVLRFIAGEPFRTSPQRGEG
jgi:hypothetical protein